MKDSLSHANFHVDNYIPDFLPLTLFTIHPSNNMYLLTDPWYRLSTGLS